MKESDYIKNFKLINRKISGKFLKYLEINYHLCLRNHHLHFNIYPKPKVILEYATISDETRSKLQVIKQDCNDIVSQCSSDTGLTHLEEMIVDTYPELPPVASKPYPLPFEIP